MNYKSIELISLTSKQLNNYYVVNKFSNAKKYLNLIIGSKSNFDNQVFFKSSGIYCILYKKKLIYMGKHTGKKSVLDRWIKHLPTLTNRFINITFLTATKSLNKLIDSYIEGKKDLYQKIDNNIKTKIEHFQSKYYCEKSSKIFLDTLKDLKKITPDSKKKIIQMLTSEGCNQTINRFKFASINWNDFKYRNKYEIFNDFECHYFKFNGQKNITTKMFTKKYEDPCIINFKPFANKENFNKYFVEYKDLPSINIDKIGSYLKIFN